MEHRKFRGRTSHRNNTYFGTLGSRRRKGCVYLRTSEAEGGRGLFIYARRGEGSNIIECGIHNQLKLGRILMFSPTQGGGEKHCVAWRGTSAIFLLKEENRHVRGEGDRGGVSRLQSPLLFLFGFRLLAGTVALGRSSRKTTPRWASSPAFIYSLMNEIFGGRYGS